MRRRRVGRAGTSRSIALVTYVGGVPEEDLRLDAALRRRGWEVAHPRWDDPSVEWTAFRLALVRSTWDYHRRRPEFLRWVRRASSAVELWNPLATLRWNTDKRYLLDLAAAGIPVPDTVRVRPGRRLELAELVAERGWPKVVVKPEVSAGGDSTSVFDRDHLREAAAEIERLGTRGTVLVQPYYRSVEGEGERSLVYLGGRYSHAVRRVPLFLRPTPPPKEVEVRASAALRRIAERALATAPEPTLYARVDLVRDDASRWRLMELEVTEPSLFFVPVPAAADRLARIVDDRFGG